MKKSKFLIPAIVFLLTLAAVVPVLARANSLVKPKASDVHVTLEWAAFTEDHVAVDYVVEGRFELPNGYLPIACPVSKARILDASGNDLTGSVVTSCRPTGENRYLVTQFFYNNYQSDLPEVLEVSIGDIALIPVGNGKVNYLPLVGTYSFKSQFKYAPDITAHPNQKAEQNGVSLIVDRVDFTPSMVKVEACITLPDTRDWIPNAYILMAGKQIHVDEWFIPNFRDDPEVFERRERCFTFLTYTDVQDFRKMDVGAVSFGINEVYTNIPECVDAQGLEKIKAELEKHGFQPQLDQSGYYCFMEEIAASKLGEADIASLFEYIEKTLPERAFGPLEVEVR